MGDVTSTCCQNTTHLQQANLTREINVIQQIQPQILPQQPFHEAPQKIRDTIRNACKSKYFVQSNSQLSLQSESHVFDSQGIITVSRKNKPSPRNSSSILDLITPSSNGQYSTYIKSLLPGNKVTEKDPNLQQNREEGRLLKVNSQRQLGAQKVLTGLFLIYFPNKQYFLGHLNKNKPTNGVFVFKPDCYYVGNIKDLRAQGEGRYENKQNSYIYEGFWSKNLQHGHGQQTYTQNGQNFKGQFMYGSKFGQGVFHFHDGKVYEGYFYNGHSDGVGKLTINKRQWYKGQWKLGSIQGKGEYHYANGDVYYGDFQNGLKHGCGRYVFAAGFEYDGEWSDGLMHGRGVIKEGYDEIEGQWVDGKKVA